MPFKPSWPLLAFSPVFLLGSFSWAAECRLGASPSFDKPALVSLEDSSGLARGRLTSSPGTGLGFSEAGQLGLLPLRLDPRLNLQPSGAQTPAYLFGQALDGQFQDQVRIEGGAALRQLGFSLRAEQLSMDMVPNRLIAKGGVTLFREGEFYKGPELSLDLGTQQGWFRDVSYEFSSLKATGQAERIDFIQPGEVVLSNASFTTCPVDRPAWRLESKTLAVDQVREMASSQGSQLYWGETPLLPLGDLSFAIGRERKSGVLPPLYRVTSNLGLELEVPYYWNIAPNRDMTLSPRLIQRRGLMLGSEFRYLWTRGQGILDLDYLGNDKVTKSDRHRVEMSHTLQVRPNIRLGLSGARVSDDNYFADFGGSLLGSSRRVLPALVTADTQWKGFQFGVQAQEFQVLQDPNAPILPPYSWLPRFTASRVGSFDTASKLQLMQVNRTKWRAQFEAVSFRHPTLAEGARFVFQAGTETSAQLGFVETKPRVGIHLTHYAHSKDGNLEATGREFYSGQTSPALGVFQPNARQGTGSYTRFVPSVSLDLFTTLEKDVGWQGRENTLTVEPRVLYVYAPYKNQDDFPVFDSAQPTVSFAQILSDRVFSGQDRIADQNNLTTALTGRILDDETGQEQLRASVAQRFYFSRQRVVLPGQIPREDMESDLFAEGGVSAFQHWRFDAVGQYAARQGRWQGGAASARYEPRPGYSAYASYRFTRDSVNIARPRLSGAPC
jgi:LPS-assembly protein